MRGIRVRLRGVRSTAAYCVSIHDVPSKGRRDDQQAEEYQVDEEVPELSAHLDRWLHVLRARARKDGLIGG